MRMEKPLYPSTQLVARLGLPKRSKSAPFIDDASGLPIDSDAPQRRRDSVSIGDVSAGILAKMGISVAEETLTEEKAEAMLAAWREVVGGELEGKVELEKFVDGILYAFVQNHTELFEIRRFKLRQIEMRAKKHPAFFGMKGIRLRVR